MIGRCVVRLLSDCRERLFASGRMKASLLIGSVGVSVLVNVVVAERREAELIVVLGVIIVGMLRDLD